MTEKYTLPTLAMAFTLLATSSAIALDRATLRTAQAGPEEGDVREKAPPADREKAAPAAREKKGDGDEPRRGRGEGAGEGEKPQRPSARDGGGGETGERPSRRARDDGDGAPPAKREAPAGGEVAPRKERPARSDDDGPGARPPPADKAEPPVKKEPAPAKIEPKVEPPARAAPKVEPEAKTAPAPKVDPERAPKAAEPGSESDTKPARPQGDDRKDRRAAPGAPDATTLPEPKSPETKAPDAKAPETKEPGSRSPAGTAPGPKGPDGKVTPAAPEAGGKDAGAPARGPGAGSAPEVKDLKELKEERKERSEDGGKRVLIEEPDKRVIIKEGGQTIIRHDETERFRRLPGTNVRREKRNGLDVSITLRPGGIEIFTEMDERGRPLRRYRRDRDGREVIYFDNRDYYRRHRDGSFIEAIIDLPPPRISIPREDYIVDYEEASDVDVYEALSAPPVEELDRTYSLEEVRRSPTLRDRMRRIDLDSINFEFGSWDVASDQYPALERVAKAIKRVIERNPDEMFLIEGHTDAVGSDEDNLSLSDRRAESVSIILTEEFGVPPENMTTQGYGEQYLKVETQDAERQNRRVAVRRITPLLSRNN